MAGLMSRTSNVVKAWISKLLDRAEDPSVTLDYSYEKQLEMLQNVKRGVADVVTAKKRLELQTQKLEQSSRSSTTRRARRSPPRTSRARLSSGRRSRSSSSRVSTSRSPGSSRSRTSCLRTRSASRPRSRPSEPEGGHQGAVLGRRGAGEDQRGGDRDRRGDGRHRPRHPTGAGQDRADAGARGRRRRARRGRSARGLHHG